MEIEIRECDFCEADATVECDWCDLYLCLRHVVNIENVPLCSSCAKNGKERMP